MRCLLVTGRFDNDGGKWSKIGQVIAQSLTAHPVHSMVFREIKCVNGGGPNRIPELVFDECANYDTILWFPEVIEYGSTTKFVDLIKNINPTCVLVTSKNNVEQKYNLEDLVQKALKQRANLFMEIQKDSDLYIARILDPLGNQFCKWSDDFGIVTSVAAHRAAELHDFTRVKSIWAGDKAEVPHEDSFLELVRDLSSRIGTFFQRVSRPNDRFVGNASFRKDGAVFITKRNVSKDDIATRDFVPVTNLTSTTYSYRGVAKPSVDSPVHLELYRSYPEINYIVHGHAYITGEPKTKSIIPCGALEEAEEIKECMGPSMTLNIKGHGFVAMASSVKDLKGIVFRLIPRPFPELAWK